MRVLHVHSGNLYGGVETLLLTLARRRELAPRIEPHYALCFDARLRDELREARSASTYRQCAREPAPEHEARALARYLLYTYRSTPWSHSPVARHLAPCRLGLPRLWLTARPAAPLSRRWARLRPDVFRQQRVHE